MRRTCIDCGGSGRLDRYGAEFARIDCGGCDGTGENVPMPDPGAYYKRCAARRKGVLQAIEHAKEIGASPMLMKRLERDLDRYSDTGD